MWWLGLLACRSQVDAARPPAPDPHWVTMPAGTFAMGSVGGGVHGREAPLHDVTLPAYQIQRHEVLAADYIRCVEQGKCPPLTDDPFCNHPNDPGMPQNCLTWNAAEAVCAWMGARLVSEAEWEYAATSGGRDQPYPWGSAPLDCTRANHAANGAPWCPDSGPVWRACEHPAGDTAEGVCELGGNLFEWTADWFAWDYTDHPTDGTAQKVPHTEFRVMRGGGIGSGEPIAVRHRTNHPPDFQYGGMGARCARPVP